MSPEQTLELIPAEALLEKVGALRKGGARLVQICATRLAEQIELTYSFEHNDRLASFRFHLPADNARVPSISSIFWCAFLYENEMHDLFNIQVDGMAVDFQGKFYNTSVKYAFGTAKVPADKPAPTPS
jgi:ech hydrogenase subunit D